MFNPTVKSLLISGMLTISTASNTLAETPTSKHTYNFSCGPNMKTYVVKSNNGQNKGIRCVKTVQSNDKKLPTIAWYGEGYFQGKTYRHVGHAFIDGNYPYLKGYASDIYGNGEYFKGNVPGNLKIKIINSSKIQVTGAWNEEWNVVKYTAYKPLKRPTTCGKHFLQFTLSTDNGKGLRCFLKVGPTYSNTTTWFGNGYWNSKNNTYSHLGTRSTEGVGAGDICGSSFGSYCNNVPYGSLQLTPARFGLIVKGAWKELWFAYFPSHG
ncbi:MAG: hypothetical protein AAF378_02395 [Cyanobacteria bacterium P01_A01_bin.84]